jgi:tetrahydromethanopterin S-methyltransferase subunit G
MKQFQFRLISALAVAVILTTLVPAGLAADQHVVKSGDLQQALVNASNARQDNIEKVETFLASEVAQQALKSVGVDAGRIHQAVPLLGDEELARLASRAADIQADFAGGLSDRTMLYVLIIVAIGSLIALLVTMP